MFSPLRHKLPYEILAIVLMPFGFLAHKDKPKEKVKKDKKRSTKHTYTTKD
jgi:hypothetical protein